MSRRAYAIVRCAKQPQLRFLIMDAPTDANIGAYVAMLKRKKCALVVRTCEPTYSTRPLLEANIRVVELAFSDGHGPDPSIVVRWLQLVDEAAGLHQDTLIAIHCVAGLGRAPLMVAIALIEQGMEPLDAIAFIRKRRPGALNQLQLRYLEGYGRRKGSFSSTCGSPCVIL